MNLTIQQKLFCITICLITFNQIIPVYCIYKPSLLGIYLFCIGILLQIWLLKRYKFNQKIQINKKILLYLFFLLCLSIFQGITHSNLILLSGTEFISFYFILTFFLLDNRMKSYLLSLFLLLATLLFFCALVEYILYLFGIDYILAPFLERGEDSGQFYAQGIFNLYRLNVLIPRFQGLFKEPGHLGVCAGLLIFAWRKLTLFQRIVWMISGILSLSLAFYILAFVALLYNASKYSFSKSLLVLGSVVTLSIVIYNSAKDIADEMIFARISEYIEEGDSRTTKDFNNDLSSMFDSSSWIYGYGSEKFFSSGYAWGNAGIKVDIYKYGCVGVGILLVMGFILSSLIHTEIKKDRLICILLFLMCYYNGDIKFGLYFWIILYFVLDKHINFLSYSHYENSSNYSLCNK